MNMIQHIMLIKSMQRFQGVKTKKHKLTKQGTVPPAFNHSYLEGRNEEEHS
jgi:hypothetical protein